MKIDLAYGQIGLNVDLPDSARPTIIRKPSVPVPASPEAVVAKAMASPIGSGTLAEIAQGRKSACILICDITRPVPNGLFLQPMVRTLLAAGIPASAITILVATGLHRPNEGEELSELVGDQWVLDTIKTVNHFAQNDDDHGDTADTGQT